MINNFTIEILILILLYLLARGLYSIAKSNSEYVPDNWRPKWLTKKVLFVLVMLFILPFILSVTLRNYNVIATCLLIYLIISFSALILSFVLMLVAYILYFMTRNENVWRKIFLVGIYTASPCAILPPLSAIIYAIAYVMLAIQGITTN